MDPALQEHLDDFLDPEEEIEAIMRLKNAGEIPDKVKVISNFDDIITCRIKRKDIREVYRSPLKVSLKAARFLESMHEHFSWSGLEEKTAPSFYRQPYGGKGVVIGVIDWGFDFAHADLCFPDGSTRCLALWDQSGSGGVYPYGYGQLYRKQDINEALKTEFPYISLGYHPAKGDPMRIGAHGTHVSTIAGGSGIIGKPGVAPEAEFIFVHLAARDTGGVANLGDSVRLLEAIDFIRRTAGERPLVINMSVGRHGGPHDGRTLVEMAMDHLLETRTDTMICQSTGNYYKSKTHHSGKVEKQRPAHFSFRVDAADLTPNELEIWYPGTDRIFMEITSLVSGQRFLSYPNTKTPIYLNGKIIGQIYHRTNEPNTSKNHINLFLYPQAPAGRWQVSLSGDQVVDGRYHAWIERDGGCKFCQSRFDDQYSDPGTTTGTICNGRNTLVVGAYDQWHNFQLAPFSSSGPTVDGRSKPDLIAPGVKVKAARSTPIGEVLPKQLLTLMSGTSMAAPRVTGTCALLMQILPRGTAFNTIRKLILEPALKFEAPADQDRMGRGLLNVTGAVAAAKKLAIQYKNKNEEIMKTIAPQVERYSPGRLVHWVDEQIEAGEGKNIIELLTTKLMPVTRDSAATHLAGAQEGTLSRSIEHFETVLKPGEVIGNVLQSGDLLLRYARGEGMVFESMLVDGTIFPSQIEQTSEIELSERAGYVNVVESWPKARRMGEEFRRRITDEEGRLPMDQLILRLKENVLISEQSPDYSPVGDDPETVGTFRKLKKNEVQYLALEGGGGKGLVYIGAIEALEKGGILQFKDGKLDTGGQIKGIAGASAGAITAVALSVGYNTDELKQLMKFNFNEFFDYPGFYSKQPKAGYGCVAKRDSHGLNDLIFQLLSKAVERLFKPKWGEANPLVPESIGQLIPELQLPNFSELLMQELSRVLQDILAQDGSTDKSIGQKLLSPALPFYLRNLKDDFGLFPGCKARQFFDDMIYKKLPAGKKRRNLNFKEHFEEFGIELVLTGSNLITGTGEYFSHLTTPNLPIADAARISMSLPFIFKPYRIDQQMLEQSTIKFTPKEKDILRGVWVDGGLWNNIPMKAFGADRTGPPKTLGIRLSNLAPVKIENLGDFIMAFLKNHVLSGSGEAGVSLTSGLAEQIIILDTGDIEVTNFNPPEDKLNELIKKAQIATVEYFLEP